VGDWVDTKKKEIIIDTSEEVGLNVNTQKTINILITHHQNARQNHNVRIANRYSENVHGFIYFGMTVTNHNFIYEEIKRRLNWGNACYN
jgi:hypothetical protein